jgi:excinuclease ABC subunit B
MRPTTDLQRRVAPFKVQAEFVPSGDQPAAIDALERRIKAGESDVVVLGATGTGKTATVAWLAERLQRPMLVMQPNKTLAAQFANELRTFFPDNAVEYFVSYYDYYQPEAYVPQTDTYIEKDSSINDEVERLRHSATNSLLTRRDVVVVASVSCIYGLGTPQEYVDRMVKIKLGDQLDRDQLLRRFVEMQYTRNDLAFSRGTFRVRGDTVEIIPVYEELAVRIEFFGDEIEALYTLNPLTGEVVDTEQEMYVFPATHYVAGPERMERAISGIEAELAGRLAELERSAPVRESRTTPGTSTVAPPGRRPTPCSTTSPKTSCWSSTNPMSRCRRSAVCTRETCHASGPWSTTGSGCPARWTTDRFGGRSSLSGSGRRSTCPRPQAPTNCPSRTAWSSRSSVPPVWSTPRSSSSDLLAEITLRAERNERVLVTTLTKKMAEDLTDYFLERGVRVRYLHSEVDTLRRVELLRELRMGEFDVLVGINLLREGLDLPEVSLVSILDADKEGFLRSGTSLVQTIGRAARNVSGQVHMYADTVTASMATAIDETNRRRAIQVAYNSEHGIDPQPLRKKIADITDLLAREDADTDQLLGGGGRQQSRGKTPVPGMGSRPGETRPRLAAAPAADLVELIGQLSDQMHAAAAELQFELAARIRDEISELKKELRGMQRAGHA